MKVLTVTIRETPRGWLNKHTGRYHKTAAGALHAIQRDGKARVSSFGGAAATVITWEPTTAVGTVVVRAIS